MSRPGVYLRRIRPNLLGNKPSDWRSFIELHSAFPDNGDIISLGDEYFVSLGAHGMHQNLLMDRAAAKPLSVQSSLTLSALVAFTFDTVVVPGHSPVYRHPAAGAKQEQNEMKRVVRKGLEGYLEMLVTTAQAMDDMFVVRPSDSIRPVPPGSARSWAYVHLPTTDKTWRLLSVYSSGLLSTTPVGRLLNFWRALEAATSKQQRQNAFANLPGLRLKRVPALLIRHAKGGRIDLPCNMASLLRRKALKRWRELILQFGTADKAFNHLYWQRRGKAAHADETAMEYDQRDLADQFRDSELVRYLARHAIEQAWA